ncbi:MAG: hypothetical protein WCG48_04195 [Candidatus Berkelbacteria bacterium]
MKKLEETISALMEFNVGSDGKLIIPEAGKMRIEHAGETYHFDCGVVSPHDCVALTSLNPTSGGGQYQRAVGWLNLLAKSVLDKAKTKRINDAIGELVPIVSEVRIPRFVSASVKLVLAGSLASGE